MLRTGLGRLLGFFVLGAIAALAQPQYQMIFQLGVAGHSTVPPTVGVGGEVFYTDGEGVFRLLPPRRTGAAWRSEKLDIDNSGGALTLGSSGQLYGTVSSSPGYAFVINPPATSGGAWSVATIYAFRGDSDGQVPWSNLVIGPDGSLFGVTNSGGVPGYGTVFQLTPPATADGAWTHSVLFSFTGPSSDGETPSNLVLGPDGTLYGLAYGGPATCQSENCGLVFELTPTGGGSWSESTVYTFQSVADGYGANSLISGAGGVLYGSTAWGGKARGSGSGGGTIFELTPPSSPGSAWTKTTLFELDTATGNHPTGIVLTPSGDIFGTNIEGGKPCKNGGKEKPGCGTIFELSPPAAPGAAWTETTVHDFLGSTTDGSQPGSGLAIGPDGTMYGQTIRGGRRNGGVIFEVAP